MLCTNRKVHVYTIDRCNTASVDDTTDTVTPNVDTANTAELTQLTQLHVHVTHPDTAVSQNSTN